MKTYPAGAGQRRLPWLALILLFAAPAWAQAVPAAQPEEAAPAPATALIPVAIEYTPTAAVRGRMEIISRRGDAASRRRHRGGEDGLAYLVLAAQDHRPRVVARGLSGMSRSWSLRGRRGHRINADFVKVVRARLRDGPTRVRVAALASARLLLSARPLDKGVLGDVLACLKAPASTVRFFAVRSLFNVAEFQIPKPRKGRLKAKIIRALIPLLDDPKPSVIAATADVLARVGFPKMPHREALIAKAKGLVDHPMAKVRGTALTLWSRLARKRDHKALAPALRRALVDGHGYVRGTAAQGLAEVGQLAAIHALVPLLDDRRRTLLKVKKGRKFGRQLILMTTMGKQVRVVALRAMAKLTESRRVPLDLGRDAGFVGAVLTGAIERARAYYAAHKTKLPKIAASVLTTTEQTGSATPH
jgi:HEAT repeat protein